MLQWFIRFTEFSESSTSFRKKIHSFFQISQELIDSLILIPTRYPKKWESKPLKIVWRCGNGYFFAIKKGKNFTSYIITDHIPKDEGK